MSLSSEEEQKRKEREARWAAEASSSKDDVSAAKPATVPEPAAAPTEKKVSDNLRDLANFSNFVDLEY